LTCTISRI